MNFSKLTLRRISLIAVLGMALFGAVKSQDDDSVVAAAVPASRFRTGEKLSYNISFGRFKDAGHADITVVSRGRSAKMDVIELRSRVKTFELVSAAFFMLDEVRNLYASPDTGLPVYISKTSNTGPIPKETIYNYLKVPTSSFDLLTLIYKAREAGGIGTFPLMENDQAYTVTFTAAKPEHIKTDAGEFDTTVSIVQSELLTANGIKDMKIGFSTDEHRVPVSVRFKTPRGEFKAILTAISLPEPVVPKVTPTPIPVATPKPTAAPTATPDTYVENQPLLAELGFQLGELLEYSVAADGKPAGTVTLNARERKRVQKWDCMLLTASVTAVEPGRGVLRLGDSIQVHVDPDTLAPRFYEAKFASSLPSLNQTLAFEPRSGEVSIGKQLVDAPIGTHTILSLIYAMRSFNLKPSKDLSNPVNDTRVAVFWGEKPVIFTLRPSNPEDITINGEKFPAQLITILTGDGAFDKLGIKVWLGTEDRVPLRFVAGGFQADLVTRSSNLAK